MKIRAQSLQIGDRLPGPFGGVITDIEPSERNQPLIRAWVDHEFVPKCYEPDAFVAVVRPRRQADVAYATGANLEASR